MKTFIVVAFLVAACTGSGNESYLSDLKADDYLTEEVVLERSSTDQDESELNDEITKQIIKSGGIDFESEKIEDDYHKIQELLPGFDAYVENENQSNTSQQIRYNLTIRVPVDQYDSLFEVLSGMAFKLQNKYSNIEDVTEQYYDLKTRIKNKQALEARYLELLKQASSIQDILEIERNLNQVRTEIEQLQGQFKYLSKRIRLSTIQLSFYEVLPYVYDSSGRKGFGARILSAFSDGWEVFLAFLVGVTTLWPFLLLIPVVIYLFRRWRRNRKKDASIPKDH